MPSLNTLVTALVASAAAAHAHDIYLRAEDGSWVRPSWHKRANPGDMIRVVLDNANNAAYTTQVGMGTPLQAIPMAVSLSQNHIIVASPNQAGQTGFFNPTTSTSYSQEPNAPGTTINTIGGQSVPVKFSHETCDLNEFKYNASIAITPPTITNQLYPPGAGAILGYGVDPAGEVPADSTLLGVYLPPNITVAECGLEINRAETGVSGGVLTMGGRDTNAYTGEFTVLNVPPSAQISRPSWSVPVGNIVASIGGADQNIISGGVASIDPLYSTITLPSDAVTDLYAAIPESNVSEDDPNRYTIPCTSNITLSFNFGGKVFTLDPRDSIIQNGTTCYGSIVGGATNIFQFGSPFLRNVYTIFGATFNATGPNFTVGFANKAAQAPSPSASAPASGSGSPTASQGGAGTGSVSGSTPSPTASRPAAAFTQSQISTVAVSLVVLCITAMLA